MSLESYRKTIAAQRDRESLLRGDTHIEETPTKKHKGKSVPASHDSLLSSKRRLRKIIISFGLIIFLFVAAIKNPPEAEIKANLKQLILEKANSIVRQKVLKGKIPEDEIGSVTLALIFGSTVFDLGVEMKVTDYILFSTFGAYVYDDYKEIKVVSGIVFFGKIIPLSSDVNSAFVD